MPEKLQKQDLKNIVIIYDPTYGKEKIHSEND